MAMSGDLGVGTQAAAQAVTPGSWMWGKVSGMTGDINANFGPDRARDAYSAPQAKDWLSFTSGVVGDGAVVAKNALPFTNGHVTTSSLGNGEVGRTVGGPSGTAVTGDLPKSSSP